MKKLVFVTGAGRGIGREIALKLAESGYAVSGCSRSINDLYETQKLSTGKVRIAQVDVRNSENLSHWLKTEIEQTGATPWGLVTAAGIQGTIGSFVDCHFDEWKEGIEINLYGTAISIQVFAKYLLHKKLPGRIVLLSGGGATQPIPNLSSYCASKAAVVRFGETVAHELKSHGITVNSIAPGAVNTAITDAILKAGPDKAGRALYEKTLKQKSEGGTPPGKAAGLTEFLISEKSAHVTGRLLSAVWDPWPELPALKDDSTDVYTLRRIVPEDRPEGRVKK